MIYEDLQDRLDDVHLYSNYFYCLCPFHEDTRPSFAVYEDADKPEGKGRFYCNGCMKSGTHEYLYKHLTGGNAVVHNLTKPVQKFLPRWAKWQEWFGSLENLVEFAHKNISKTDYLKKRVLEKVYEPCKLGFYQDWLFFPIFDQQGKVIDVIVRDTLGREGTKYIIHPNEEETPLLYVPNWKRVTQSPLVYIVYGIIDALALELCGLPVITGSTGQSLSSKRLLGLGKQYVIIPDKGEERAATRLAKELGNFTEVRRLRYDEDCKDPDEVRQKHSLDYLRHLILTY